MNSLTKQGIRILCVVGYASVKGFNDIRGVDFHLFSAHCLISGLIS